MGEEVSKLSRAQARAAAQAEHRLHLPELQPDRRAHGVRERRAAAAVPARAAGRAQADASTPCSRRSGSAARREHLPQQLSGGQQQRVAVARALVGRAEADPRGRADRQPRHHERRGSHEHARAAQRGGHHRGHGDALAQPRRVRPAHRQYARRPRADARTSGRCGGRRHMLSSYLSIALRHLVAQRMYSGINVVGPRGRARERCADRACTCATSFGYDAHVPESRANLSNLARLFRTAGARAARARVRTTRPWRRRCSRTFRRSSTSHASSVAAGRCFARGDTAVL